MLSRTAGTVGNDRTPSLLTPTSHPVDMAAALKQDIIFCFRVDNSASVGVLILTCMVDLSGIMFVRIPPSVTMSVILNEPCYEIYNNVTF